MYIGNVDSNCEKEANSNEESPIKGSDDHCKVIENRN